MRPRSRLGQAIAYEGAFQRWVWIRRWGSTISVDAVSGGAASTTMVGPIGSGALHGLLNSLALPVGYVVARAALGGERH